MLFWKMFPDSSIAKHYGFARTKTSAIMKEMSTKESSSLVENLRCYLFSIATDGSNDVGLKLYPIVMNCVRWAFNIKQWIPTPDEWQRATTCVQKEELEKIHRFVYCQDAKASMVGRLLMRKAASESSGISYNKIQFTRTERGKPVLCNYDDKILSPKDKFKYGFNVSHHGDFCVIAAQNINNIGIDVMKVEYKGERPLLEYFEFMKNQFSYTEYVYLTHPGLDKQKLDRFYRLWCLKESYVKATGIGISCDLKNISFHCPTVTLSQNDITSDTQVFINGCLEENWRFEETFLDQNHVVSVAIKVQDVEDSEGDITCPKFTLLTFEDLMRNSIPFEIVDHNYWCIFSYKKDKLAQ